MYKGLSWSLDSKESSCNAGDPDLIPGLGRSPVEGNGNPLQYSCLENPMDGEALQATVHGIAKSWTRLSYWHIYFHFSYVYKQGSSTVKFVHHTSREKGLIVQLRTSLAFFSAEAKLPFQAGGLLASNEQSHCFLLLLSFRSSSFWTSPPAEGLHIVQRSVQILPFPWGIYRYVAKNEKGQYKP